MKSNQNKTYKILLVDDNFMNAFYAKTVLEKSNYTVSVANNGFEALENLKLHTFDLVLMDVQMPLMDGYETSSKIRIELRKSVRDLPIVMLTGNDESMNDLEPGIQYVNDILNKPYTPKDLIDKVRKFLNDGNGSKLDSKKVDKSIKYSNTSPINLDYLSEVCDNDPKFIREMMQSFIKNTPNDFRHLTTLIDNNNWIDAAEYAHKLKSAVRFVGATTLIDLLNSVEKESLVQKPNTSLNLLMNDAEILLQEIINHLSDEIKKL